MNSFTVSIAQIGPLWTTLISSALLRRFNYDGLRCSRLDYAAATTIDFCYAAVAFLVTSSQIAVARRLFWAGSKEAPPGAAHGTSGHFCYAHAVSIPFVLRSMALLGDLDQFCHRSGSASQWNGGIKPGTQMKKVHSAKSYVVPHFQRWFYRYTCQHQAWSKKEISDVIEPSLYTLNTYPWGPYFRPFCSTDSGLQDTWSAKIGNAPNDPQTELKHLTVKSIQ